MKNADNNNYYLFRVPKLKCILKIESICSTRKQIKTREVIHMYGAINLFTFYGVLEVKKKHYI